jgi:hypothetical protein
MTILVVTSLALATVLLALSAWLRPRSTAPIVDDKGRPRPGGIATLEQVKIGGVNQGLLIRGHESTKAFRRPIQPP